METLPKALSFVPAALTSVAVLAEADRTAANAAIAEAASSLTWPDIAPSDLAIVISLCHHCSWISIQTLAGLLRVAQESLKHNLSLLLTLSYRFGLDLVQLSLD
jgi:hypothetical protein